VAYAPVSGGQKVYILDEAHMLSTAAWNAFLKTLEEPPPNTIFVLATTEAQKVLPTVVDRCHRFDFHRPTADQIATVLRRTAVAGTVDTGPDPAGFVRELEAHVREVLVVQTLDLHVPPEIAVTPERDDQISDQATRIPPATLVRLLDLLAAALAALRDGADGRTQLELALVKAARPPLDASTDALLERIARLETALAAAPPPPPAPHPPPPASQAA